MGKTREELEAALEELYKELGKAYYEIGMNDPLPELLEQLNAVSECKDEIIAVTEEEEQKKAFLEKQKKIAASICLECDQPVPAGSNFCNHCGKPMPDAEMVAEAVKALAELEETAEEDGTQTEETADKPVEAVYEETQDETPAADPDATVLLDPAVQEAFKEPEHHEETAVPEEAVEPVSEPTQKFCKMCGHLLLPKHKFCPGCGKPVAQC